MLEYLENKSANTDEDFAKLEFFNGTLSDMIELAHELFDHTYGSWTIETTSRGQRISIVTGGWSENENVLSALGRTLFHSLYWESSFSGGLVTYVVSDSIDSATVLNWGNPITMGGRTNRLVQQLDSSMEGFVLSRETDRVEQWPADEAAAYRDNGGFLEGRDAVRAVRLQKIAEKLSEFL